jgi:hypothetical protein
MNKTDNYLDKHRMCLALGPADGQELLQISTLCKSFVCIEPEEQWWNSYIGSTPSEYIKPNIDGSISLNKTVDLAICFGVLHHIPNVSFIIEQVSNNLSSGGVLLIREPITAMGDWRVKRKNMTPRERGIPLEPLLDALRKQGFNIKRTTYFGNPVCIRGFQRVLKISKPFNNVFAIYVDKFFSFLTKFNMHYLPKNIISKIAPSSIFIVAIKK